MPKTKISEYSATNSANTDIEGINIDEGCPPSSINNAIRELMVHLKEFQTGASGDAFTFAGGTLMSGTNTISGAAVISGNINSSGTTNTFSGGNIFSGTNTFSGTNVFSSDVTLNAQKDLRFADSDSSNWVAFQSPATVASNVTWTLSAADGTSNQVLATNGSGTLSWATASSSQWTTSGSDISYTTGSVGIGSSTIRGTLNVSDGTLNTAGEGVYQGYIVGADRSALTEGNLTVQSNDAMAVDKGGSISFGGRAVSASSAGANWARIAGRKENATTSEFGGYIQFATRPNSGAMAERARITSGGFLLVGKTTTAIGTAGFVVGANDVGSAKAGALVVTVDGEDCIYINRLTSDGNLISFRQDGTQEGTISVSGTTVSYNGGHLSRWAQMPGTKDDTLVKGTVMSNLDEMNVYTDAEGNPVDNEQLNKVKVSDVEGDVNVAGVFVNWTYDEAHQVDEINMAMTGDMIIRIAQGVVVQKGDLLVSAGDGTAKPQDDDIVRSKTVAKVTSNHVTCTYADGSYCVPCVLMAC